MKTQQTTTIVPARPRQFEHGVTHDVYVVDTQAVAGAGTPGFLWYEISLAPEPSAEAPRVALITRRLDVYECAREAEDGPRRFDAHWHRTSTRFGIKYELDHFRVRPR
jgi:hypothetical protein